MVATEDRAEAPKYRSGSGENKPFKPFTHRYRTPYRASGSTEPFCYDYHYMEGETMRVMYEPWFVKNKVDIVFSGHVHAYEKSERISNIAYNVVNGICSPVRDQSAPVYITIGDGGNIEGLATNFWRMTEPQPKYSAFREASFGHTILSIKNRTHTHYGWHRNQDSYTVEAEPCGFTTDSGILLMILLLSILENL
ncbi:hypothetical protein F2Q70_00030813 [Brassica cretica]|uniref:Purple acid phosphatase C-terminal domain-containing protein n=1 Tax=Brassica cretica TaxID=69181 RepID=A0A8S9FIC8_BRACR|nr:hypothetical protein F2Q70_00030813 [Brassica cretica]